MRSDRQESRVAITLRRLTRIRAVVAGRLVFVIARLSKKDTKADGKAFFDRAKLSFSLQLVLVHSLMTSWYCDNSVSGKCQLSEPGLMSKSLRELAAFAVTITGEMYRTFPVGTIAIRRRQGHEPVLKARIETPIVPKKRAKPPFRWRKLLPSHTSLPLVSSSRRPISLPVLPPLQAIVAHTWLPTEHWHAGSLVWAIVNASRPRPCLSRPFTGVREWM